MSCHPDLLLPINQFFSGFTKHHEYNIGETGFIAQPGDFALVPMLLRTDMLLHATLFANAWTLHGTVLPVTNDKISC